MRIFVLSGWFGRGPLSAGMALLANRLKPYGDVTYHAWNDQSIISSVNASEGKVAIIGFSLGANELGWMDPYFKRKVDLGVAYDPSKQSPLARRDANGEYVQHVMNYKRLLCYYHPNAWVYGGSKYVGKGVETSLINLPHLSVQFSEALHSQTLTAIAMLEKN